MSTLPQQMAALVFLWLPGLVTLTVLEFLWDNMADVKIEDAEGSRPLEEPLRKQLDIFNWISTVIKFAYVPFLFLTHPCITNLWHYLTYLC